MNNLDKLKLIYEGEGASFSQSPQKWLDKHNIKMDIDNLNLTEIKIKIHTQILGISYCKNCGYVVDRIYPGWRGFALTCSDECECELSSKRMAGKGNSYHKMTESEKRKSAKKQSETMKQKIIDGSFTPKTNNYITHKMLKFKNDDGVVVSVRSLWEMIFWVNNPNMKYEHIRIKYYDTEKKKERIYITDFYDESTNTIYEVKPKKYKNTLKDKSKAVISQGYNYKIIDEDYFQSSKTPQMVQTLKEKILNFEDIESRLKWIKKA